MLSTLACPEENELLALAMGEHAADAVTVHVDECPSCKATLERLQAEVALLRQNHGDGTTPLSTERDPTADRDAEPSSVGTTQDWTSADPPGTTATDELGPEAVSAARNLAEGQGTFPDAIGKYKVVGWLGKGGEADVYRVVHIKLGNDLVLKLSRKRVSADDQSGLFDEGKLLVDLQHPNLVRIYDCDFHDDRPFLVMEYVHGRNLEQYAGEESVTQRRAASLVAKLAAVMAVAHRHGIIHCDIKPRNVLIDKLGEPRLIDFGMARLRHAWTDCAQTSWGGTVAYMAPEQARLEVDRIGPRSDIFALGGVLYFLLTGQAPFSGKDQDEIWERARRCEFEAGALRAAKVPRRLERMCLKAMEADPSRRHSSAESLTHELDAFLARPRRLAVLTGLLLLAAVLAAGLTFIPVWAQPPNGSHASGGREASASPVPSVPLRVEALEVEVHRRLPEPAKTLGRIGIDVFEGRYQDNDVRVHARLSAPAYCYVIALNPDGKDQLFFPEDPATPPPARAQIDAPADSFIGFGLTDGVGRQGVVLLASRQPLPAYAEWVKGRASSPWRSDPSTGVWRFDGERFDSAPEPESQRGPTRPLADAPKSFVETCRVFRGRPGVAAMAAVAFPVREAAKPGDP
jgi:tRNA A-37 threonylcarbamoyl transferase component Bud32